MMMEKILTVLVMVCLVLSAFNLMILLRTNGIDTIARALMGQSSNTATWEKVQCSFKVGNEYIDIYYSNVNPYYLSILFNVTLAVQWFQEVVKYDANNKPISTDLEYNGTTTTYDFREIPFQQSPTSVSLPDAFFTRINVGGSSYSLYSPLSKFLEMQEYTGAVAYWNITSVTAYVPTYVLSFATPQ